MPANRRPSDAPAGASPRLGEGTTCCRSRSGAKSPGLGASEATVLRARPVGVAALGPRAVASEPHLAGRKVPPEAIAAHFDEVAGEAARDLAGGARGQVARLRGRTAAERGKQV